MITHHTSTGARHEGDEWDCPFCRESLLEAFRAPADAPEEPPAPERACVAHPAASGPFRRASGPLPAPAPEHDATVRVLPHPDRPGGEWRAACVCGWSKTGAYARDGFAEVVAGKLAAKYAQTHLNHPEAEL